MDLRSRCETLRIFIELSNDSGYMCAEWIGGAEAETCLGIFTAAGMPEIKIALPGEWPLHKQIRSVIAGARACDALCGLQYHYHII